MHSAFPLPTFHSYTPTEAEKERERELEKRVEKLPGEEGGGRGREKTRVKKLEERNLEGEVKSARSRLFGLHAILPATIMQTKIVVSFFLCGFTQQLPYRIWL